MEITLGHTPDADDAFMFYGIASGKVRSSFAVKHVIQDIETLNRRALKHELDVTAVSAHAFAYLQDYVILKSGGSFGLNYGPIVITKKENKMTPEQLQEGTIAIPGKMTSANLLLLLAIGKFNEQEMSFDAIPDAVAAGRVDAGLVIHEAQITYDRNRFSAALDLGSWWTENMSGLPVPLGINVASARTMSAEQIEEFSDFFTRSVKYGLDNIDAAVDYAMQYGRGQPKETITRFVKMYVNKLTVDMGHDGKIAIERMFEMAKERKVIDTDVVVKVV
ncbi:MAG: ABC transporter substrate-binding protein [Nitrososphaera sp.]|jgi:1,4-dihydroxy-6-naphthoate synthase